MSERTHLRFAVSGGSGVGLGHVMRCAAIAADARARGLRVTFALDGDEHAEEALRGEIPGAHVEAWKEARDLARPTDWVVFDSRRDLIPHLRAARRASARTAVLDRLDYLEEADVSVLPVLHAAPSDHPRVMQGARYCVTAPAVRDLDPTPYRVATRNVVLVTLGGADPLALTARVTPEVARCLSTWPENEPRRELHCVIGPAFRDRAQLARTLRGQHWHVHEAPSRSELAEMMNRSLFCVVGFGTTVYDLAYMGVPMVYVTHHRSDTEDACRLSEQGIGMLGANGSSFDAVEFRGVLARTLLDPDWRVRSSARGRELLRDGNGGGRILDELFSES